CADPFDGEWGVADGGRGGGEVRGALRLAALASAYGAAPRCGALRYDNSRGRYHESAWRRPVSLVRST
ncbi:MAG: hypothetical protein ABI625_27900, partial [bacterium]